MGFDQLARVYATLERAVYGDLLQRVRVAQVDRIAAAGEVLLLGDGDGRFLEALLIARAESGQPPARVLSVDASAGMLERARLRIAGLPGAEGVSFVHQSAEQFEPPDGFRAEVLVSHFFLDCFDDDALGSIVCRLGACARPDALWVNSDFAIPPRPSLLRIPARLLLWVMYRFFRVTTGLAARTLPNFHKALSGNGWRERTRSGWLGGFVLSAVWARGG